MNLCGFTVTWILPSTVYFTALEVRFSRMPERDGFDWVDSRMGSRTSGVEPLQAEAG